MRTNIPGVEEFAKEREQIREEVQAALEESKTRMKRLYDRKVGLHHEYEKGDLVWISASNIRTERPSQKLEHRRFGPFKITRKVGASAYQLAIPPEWKKRGVHPVFNESLLSPYVAPYFPSQQVPEPPPPILIDLEDETPEYEVESIVDSRIYRGKLQYKVKWLGYSHSHDSWEPLSHVEHAQELIEEFHDTYPLKPRPAAD